MERFNKEICSGPSLTFFCLISVAILSMFSFPSAIVAATGFENVSMKSFISPKYNEKTSSLEYILHGKNAQTIGAFIKISDVKIKMIANDGKSITSVITTPEAFFNRSTEIIKGDKPIHYQSLGADIDGIGFDCNMKTQFFHIRENVKMLITSTDSLQDQNNLSPIKSNDNKTDHHKIGETK